MKGGELLKKVMGHPIAYHAIHAKITGSVTGGLLLSQLCYWQRTMDDEFYKTNDDIAAETGMTLREVKAAKKKVQKLPFVRVEVKGVPCRTFYFVDFDMMHEYLIQPVGTKGTNQLGQNVPTSWDKSDQPVGTKRTNQLGQNVPTSWDKSDQLYITENKQRINREKAEKDPPPNENSISPKNPNTKKISSPARENSKEWPDTLIRFLEGPVAPEFFWEAYEVILQWAEKHGIYIDWTSRAGWERNRDASVKIFDKLRIAQKIPQDGTGLAQELERFLGKVDDWWYANGVSLESLERNFEKINNSRRNGNSKRDNKPKPEDYRKIKESGPIYFS